jgi:two-component system cell cycle sensor histidine kinase/response regulator CckA
MEKRAPDCVLLVEDDATVRKSMSDALSGRGYCVIQAADGWDAIRLADEYDGLIHALVTDFHISGLDGHDLAAQLKPEHPDLRVLIVSSAAEKDFPADSKYDAYLKKPVSPSVVAFAVHHLLQD